MTQENNTAADQKHQSLSPMEPVPDIYIKHYWLKEHVALDRVELVFEKRL